MVETLDPTTTTTKLTEPHLEKFEWFEKDARQPGWVFPLRKAGIARFAEMGFPTTEEEDWRFTNVLPIARLPFKPVLAPAAAHEVTAEIIAGLTFGKLPALRMVFLNGHFVAGLSHRGPLPAGVTLASLADSLRMNDPALEQHIARYASSEMSAFTSLNNAFFQDGAFLHIRAGKSIEGPILLLFLTTGRETGATSHPRNLILLEEASAATIVESHLSLGQAATFTNAVTEMVVGPGASIEHTKFQDEDLHAFHIAALHAELGAGCNFVSHSFATGAKLSRNNIRAVLGGDGVECLLNGLYLTRGDQLADHHMVVEHAAPRCNSHEYFNGILDGRSKGVFHGRILVRPVAQKTDAKQTNKNLLLSENATADTKPQLEIYADDVKCTHGATIGQLNEESIFYLRSRGIGTDTARRMLIHAFAGEIIERIRHPQVREELDKLVWDRLEANPHVAARE